MPGLFWVSDPPRRDLPRSLNGLLRRVGQRSDPADAAGCECAGHIFRRSGCGLNTKADGLALGAFNRPRDRQIHAR